MTYINKFINRIISIRINTVINTYMSTMLNDLYDNYKDMYHKKFSDVKKSNVDVEYVDDTINLFFKIIDSKRIKLHNRFIYEHADEILIILFCFKYQALYGLKIGTNFLELVEYAEVEIREYKLNKLLNII